MRSPVYSCQETCGQTKECGNRYCSANSKYIPPVPKEKKAKTANQQPRPFYLDR